jgi:hypothetical protein
MADATWQTSGDPHKMLGWLRELGRVTRTKAGRRKLRLFACACCRRLWYRLPSDACRRAVEIIERYADGLADKAELAAARTAVRSEVQNEERRVLRASGEERARLIITTLRLCEGVVWAADDEAWRAAVQASNWSADTAAVLASGTAHDVSTWAQALPVERRAHCDLLRDVFCNPFKLPAVQPAWLKWNHGTIPGIARGIYDDQAFERLGVLADALEDAGCSDAVILDHCRKPGEHVRGCWLVDLILCKDG